MAIEITDGYVEKAIEYLASTDESHAKAKAYYHALYDLRKTVRAKCYEGKTGGVKDKEMAAECDPVYTDHIEATRAAEEEFIYLQNKRKRAELTVDLYRTYAANQRRGNV